MHTKLGKCPHYAPILTSNTNPLPWSLFKGMTRDICFMYLKGFFFLFFFFLFAQTKSCTFNTCSARQCFNNIHKLKDSVNHNTSLSPLFFFFIIEKIVFTSEQRIIHYMQSICMIHRYDQVGYK